MIKTHIYHSNIQWYRVSIPVPKGRNGSAAKSWTKARQNPNIASITVLTVNPIIKEAKAGRFL